jgi:hypothetical protein
VALACKSKFDNRCLHSNKSIFINLLCQPQKWHSFCTETSEIFCNTIHPNVGADDRFSNSHYSQNLETYLACFQQSFYKMGEPGPLGWGSLESETVKHGHEFRGNQTRE